MTERRRETLMMPSLPIEVPVKSKLIEVIDPLPCSMLRFGLPCGNDTFSVFLCPEPGEYYRLIAVCQLCMDEVSGRMEAITGISWPMWIEQQHQMMFDQDTEREWIAQHTRQVQP